MFFLLFFNIYVVEFSSMPGTYFRQLHCFVCLDPFLLNYTNAERLCTHGTTEGCTSNLIHAYYQFIS